MGAVEICEILSHFPMTEDDCAENSLQFYFSLNYCNGGQRCSLVKLFYI